MRDDPHTELRARAALRGLVPAVRGQLDAQQDHGNQAAMRGVTAVVGQLAAQQGQDYCGSWFCRCYIGCYFGR